MPIVLYGFKSCDTVRKARAWLTNHGVEHEFFDYRVSPLAPETVKDWFRRAGWEAVFNRNSATFRELSDAAKAKLDESSALEMILGETNFIKRPVLDTGDKLLFGFRPELYEGAMRTHTL